jgi:hypothetical protein
VHDTPVSPLNVAPAGAAGVFCVQLVPLKCAVNGTVTPPLLSKEPAAMQLIADAHETLAYRLPVPGPAVAVTAQLVPLKCSTSAFVTLAFVYEPTASQLVVDTHATPPRRVEDAPVTFALVLIAHDDPFHSCVSVFVTPPLAYWPTATQLEAEAHDTPFS